MAKKGRKGFVALPVSANLSIGALADDTVVSGSLFGNNLTEDLFIISTDLTWSVRDLTAGEGPIECGLSHSDYTDTEIEECLSANLFDPSDLVAAEHSRRKVRRVGKFAGLSTEEVLNDGKPVRRKVKFRVDDGKTLEIFVANRSGAQLTSGAELVVDGLVYGRWMF